MTPQEVAIINKHEAKEEDRIKADLEKMGIEVTKRWPVGDNAYSPEWTLYYSEDVGHIQAIGPTLDMTLAEFVGKLLKARRA